MPEVTTENPVAPLSERAPVSLPPSSALHRWTEELRRLLNCYPCADVQDWQLQGHALLLETTAPEEVPALLEHIADTVDIPLHIFSPTAVLEDFLPWIGALPDDEPALIYLMPGDWMNPSMPGMEEQPAFAVEPCPDDFLRTLQEVIQGLDARAIVLVTATRGFEQLSPCLRQVGYFDRRIQVPEWSADALVDDFLSEIGVALMDESARAKRERLGALLKTVFPDKRRRSLVVLALKRLAHREQRCINFADLVQIAARGTSEDDPIRTDPSVRRRTAVHEAGHALITHLDSSMKIAPVLCTAIKSGDCHGLLVSAFEAPETRSDDLTLANVRHKIRVKLAGRAAEHLVLGIEASSAMGAGSDLDEATGLATRMFADWGIALDSSTPASQASNLATVINGCNPSESPRIVDMVRQYLQSEFMKTTDILRQHRAYLDRIVTALCQQDVLTQEDFEQLWSEQEENRQQELVDSGHVIEAPPRPPEAFPSSTTFIPHHDT